MNEAMEFARLQNIKTRTEWIYFFKSNQISNEVPIRPDAVYKNNGWKNWGYFLGTGYVSNRERKYLPYEKAKKIIHKLNLKSSTEYQKQHRLGKIPSEIPLSPSQAYERKGWENWGIFLGNNKLATYLMVYKTFEDARSFVRKLALKSRSEWLEYCKSGLKPDDIPSNPHNTYKENGWNGMADFLGSQFEYLTFLEAKEYVQKLNLSNNLEWREYCISGKKPNNIPSDVGKIYKDEGWKGMKDFLGTSTKYVDYETAKLIVRKFNIKSQNEWFDFCKSGKKPNNIPVSVMNVYQNKGWTNWGEFLGTGKVADNIKKYRSFTEVKKFVHKLKFQSQREWKAFAKSNEKPPDIPFKVERTYSSEWVSWQDFLGK